MTVRDCFLNVSVIEIPASGPPVETTVAHGLQIQFGINELIRTPQINLRANELRFQIAVVTKDAVLNFKIPTDSEWVYFQIQQNGKGKLLASSPNLLYSLSCRITEEWLDLDADQFANGKLIHAAFHWHRVNFDNFVSNYGRTVRNLNLEAYARELARNGYSHWEVNALASPIAQEEGVYHEVYPRFYTYAAALDQFVESRLNKGTYPVEYLTANLNKMKKMSGIGLRYGLTPGMQSFEPRNMPEKFFQRYPFLRGPRVDHPFRSQKPRFALTLAHPVAQEHYIEMMENLLRQIPQLGFIKIITNDSGAGLEFTKSLYVGSNGGAYLIREWKPDREIAKAAAQNAVRFLRLLHDAAIPFNPDFRVLTHLDPLYSEREFFLSELDNRIDIEGNSFLGTGWDALDAPYHHPEYEDVKTVIGSAFHTKFDPREKKFIDTMQAQNVHCHISYSHSFTFNTEPLIGIPFPWLTYKKLKSMYDLGIADVGHSGGIIPNSHAPWFINQEVLREFHLNQEMKINDFIQSMAKRWVGEALAASLVTAWRMFEQAWLAYPPVFLYSGFGHSWYKLWVRPIVPDIEKIPEKERAYYEDFMLTTPHNPTRVDFNRDVMFHLTTPEAARKMAERIDLAVKAPLNEAIQFLEDTIRSAICSSPGCQVLVDQRDRFLAFKCWLRTLRNVAAWIAGVHTYLSATDQQVKNINRQLVHDLVIDEIENAKALLDLWETSGTEFMMISDVGETTFIYGENFGEKVKRKIELMQGHENDEPYIDPNFLWRVPGYELERKALLP